MTRVFDDDLDAGFATRAIHAGQRREPLAGVANDFVQSVTLKKDPLSNAQLGRAVVRILEASQESIKHNGKEVRLN